MEGFVNTNVSSPFDYGLKHSKSYANYGVDKSYLKREQQNQDKTISEQNLQAQDSYGRTVMLSSGQTSQLVGGILPEIPEKFDQAVIDSVDTVTDTDQTGHKRLKTAGIIGGSAIVVGGAVLALTRGKLSAKLIKKMGTFIDNVGNKIDELKQKPSTSLMEGYYMSFLKLAHGATSRLRGALFNITPLKDVLFAKLVKNVLRLEKPCDAITNGFRNLSFRTVKSAYKSTDSELKGLVELFGDTNKKILNGEIPTVAKPKETVITNITSMTEQMESAFQTSFGEQVIESRNKDLIARFSGLDKKVFSSVFGKLKKFVGDIDEWTTFVPERLVAKDKAQIMKNLASKKRVITNNPQDNYKQMVKLISDLELKLDPMDKSSRKLIKSIKSLAEKYLTASGDKELQIREDVVNEINKNLKNITNLTHNESYSPDEAKKIKILAGKIGEVLNCDKKGLLEEILTNYKEILPREEYLKLKKSADKLSQKLNRAVQKEGSEYVDKARDLAVGSALTDVAIGMGLPLATTSIAISAADTKQKKRSVVLRYGLPLLAGVLTSTLCTVALISGGNALMLGGAVSLIGNRIFEQIDNYLIKRDETNKEQQ